MRRLLALAVVLLFSAACGRAPATVAELEAANPVRPLPEKLVGHEFALASVKHAPEPEKARLGRWLFFDGRLSADGTISCATCHMPEHGFSEPTPTSTGIDGQVGGRKAPSFLNAAFAFYPETFWDGRAGSLEEQAKGPIENPIEMGETHENVVAKLSAIPGYRHFFGLSFGDDAVTIDRIAEALADYERTRVSGNSTYDKWVAYDEDEYEGYDQLMTAQEQRGEELFFGDAKCATCHVGNHFTDSLFHNLGVGWDAETEALADLGRFVVTGEEKDRGAFKTPTLRDVGLHAPYMHDGSQATLEDVVEHYRKGGEKNPWLSPKMFELELSDEDAAALVAFMHCLTGEGYADVPPAVFP